MLAPFLLFIQTIFALSPANNHTNPKPYPHKITIVRNESQLQKALDNAQKGDEIYMTEGIYHGQFVIPANHSGTPDQPILLRGNSKVILDAGTTETNYVLHLQAHHWTLQNFTITNGLKGLVCDGANYNILDSLTVHEIGEEAIHLRKFSSHNIIQHCNVYNTGLKTPDYGEGIYIGTATSNWSKYTNGEPDKCDENIVQYNTIGPNVAAECIDLKEGTTGGIIRDNNFNSKGITGANSADSWIDVKGNHYLIENNIGYNPPAAS